MRGHGRRAQASARALALALARGLAAALALPLALGATAAGAQQTIVISGKRTAPDGAQGAGSTLTEDQARWRERGSPDFSHWLHQLPGVQANSGEPGRSLPTLRGIGTVTDGTQLGTQQATTGLYLEDVPLTDPFGYVGTPDLTGFDIARLEVLRGPQGVLYGSGSLGGALHIVLAQPGGDTERSVGRWTLRLPAQGRAAMAVAAALDRPVGDRGDALRVEAFIEGGGGDVDNLGTGQADANRQARRGARLAGLWQVAPGAALRLSLLHQRSSVDDGSAVWPDASQRANRTPSASWRRLSLSVARAEVVATPLPDLRLSSVSAWVDKQDAYGTDLTRSSGTLGRVIGPLFGLGALPDLALVRSTTGRPMRSRAASQELRLASGGADGVHWMAGLFVQQTRFDSDSASVAPDAASQWGPLAAGLLLPGDQIGALRVSARSRESALFGEASWRLTRQLRATAGARVYRAALAYDASLRYLGQDTRGSPRTADRGLMPRLALEWAQGAHSAYALVSRGYRVGGVNFDPPAFTPYRPDRLLNQEIGLRLHPATGASLDLALFQMDWRDAQVSTLLTEPLPLIGVANVGQARSRGLEAAARFTLAAGTSAGLRVALIEATTRQPFVTAAGRPVAAGARLPGTPRRQLALDLRHTLALPAGWAGQARLDLGARSRRVDEIGGAAAAPGRAQLGVGLSAWRGPWQWQVRLDNAGDVTEVAGVAVIDRPGLPPLTERTLTPPRRWTLTLSHEH